MCACFPARFLEREHLLSTKMLCKHLKMNGFLIYTAEKHSIGIKALCRRHHKSHFFIHIFTQGTKLYFINICAKIFAHKSHKIKNSAK